MRSIALIVASALSCASSFLLSSRAYAGPVELFNGVEFASGDADRLVAHWVNGDSGFFVSKDRGATFRISCFPAISSGLMGRSVQAFKTATDGSMCVGTTDKVFCSDAQGCGWTEATELSGKWISDFAEDPIDRNVLYLGTGTGSGNNGLFVRETPSAAWKPFGTQLPAWFSRVHVVKNGSGKRFYVSSQENVVTEGMDGGPPTQEIKYFVRYSDDDAVTWISNYYGPTPERANLRLVGVDPTNPDRIVVLLLRSAELAPDDLYYSDKRGEPGSYIKIGTVTQYSGVTFTPGGELYYGDNDQMTPGLFKVARLGEPPTKISGSYKVGCVGYDALSDRLYVCADWKFGTADRTTGEFAKLFQLADASTFLECSGEADLDVQCAPAFRSPNFCDITHWSNAPVCVQYFGTAAAGDAAAGSGAGEGGMVAGSGGSPATAGTGGRSMAGSNARQAGSGGTAHGAGASASSKPKNSDCSILRTGVQKRQDGSGVLLALSVVFAWTVRRKTSGRLRFSARR